VLDKYKLNIGLILEGEFMIDIFQRREILKANFLELKKITTDQQNNIPPPALEKPFDRNLTQIELPDPEFNSFSGSLLTTAIQARKSHRKYTNTSISIEELNYLLWATQGVKNVSNRNGKAIASFRSVPSAGARHPFETYLIIFNVETLEPGVYRYLPFENKLLFLHKEENLHDKIIEATLGQKFSGESAVVFVWSTIPYRAEWRYNISAQKGILLDAGHVCQNLYLACEEIGSGTCAISAYDQQKIDELLKLDGNDEFVVYISPVGKLK